MNNAHSLSAWVSDIQEDDAMGHLNAKKHDVLDLVWEDELSEGGDLHQFLLRAAEARAAARAARTLRRPAAGPTAHAAPTLSDRDIDSFTTWLWG
jgi:hypothetical protein